MFGFAGPLPGPQRPDGGFWRGHNFRSRSRQMKTGRARTEKPVKKRSLNKVSIECTNWQPGTRARAPNLAASHYRWEQQHRVPAKQSPEN
ncbi:unnamed protein product [Macrosiphum euphorbiae]|uniref:Uncharacterized protein n=1 Tax=Macrosiphum euphorbiae TaxID=13131 RepID=A0AAV0XB43_9HEMI|nr:unnamed protein product [Macrosiphum euphorbiae]